MPPRYAFFGAALVQSERRAPFQRSCAVCLRPIIARLLFCRRLRRCRRVFFMAQSFFCRGGAKRLTGGAVFAVIIATNKVAIKGGRKKCAFQIAVRTQSLLHPRAELSRALRERLASGKGDRRFGQIYRKDHAYALVYIYGRTSQSHRVIAGHLKVIVKSCQKSHKKRERYRSPDGVEN